LRSAPSELDGRGQHRHDDADVMARLLQLVGKVQHLCCVTAVAVDHADHQHRRGDEC
jgi:hypothetical protein